jgi:hypothetical protein
MKGTSHARCNAVDVRFRRVLHRICYSNAEHARIMCTTSEWDVRGMLVRQYVTYACHTGGMRTSDAFVARVSSILVFQRVGIAREHELPLVSTVVTNKYISIPGSVIYFPFALQ